MSCHVVHLHLVLGQGYLDGHKLKAKDEIILQ